MNLLILMSPLDVLLEFVVVVLKSLSRSLLSLVLFLNSLSLMTAPFYIVMCSFLKVEIRVTKKVWQWISYFWKLYIAIFYLMREISFIVAPIGTAAIVLHILLQHLHYSRHDLISLHPSFFVTLETCYRNIPSMKFEFLNHLQLCT